MSKSDPVPKPPIAQAVGLWVLERCPNSPKLPYRLTITRNDPPMELVLRVGSAWPTGAQNVFCKREESASPIETREELERVPMLAVARAGAKLTIVLDRPRLKRCDFVFVTRRYKNPTPERETYENIFWRTQLGVEANRPRANLAAPVAPLSVRVAHEERYPWTFPGATATRGRLPCGDYALLDGETIAAVIERKTFQNLVQDFGNLAVLHQRLTDVAAYEHHALVVEGRYEDFLNPKKDTHWGATFCARALAELYARHPRLRIVFLANRKSANTWARHYFAAVRRLVDEGGVSADLAANSSVVLPPRGRRKPATSAQPASAAKQPVSAAGASTMSK